MIPFPASKPPLERVVALLRGLCRLWCSLPRLGQVLDHHLPPLVVLQISIGLEYPPILCTEEYLRVPVVNRIVITGSPVMAQHLIGEGCLAGAVRSGYYD